MVGKFIRENRYAAGPLTVVRVLLGWKWMTSGWGKLTGSAPFQADDYLKKAIEGSVGDKATVQGWWGNFLHDVALPNVHVFNFLVPWGEFLIGLALILGLATIFAAFMGAIMNFSFFLSGSISIIPQMLMVVPYSVCRRQFEPLRTGHGVVVLFEKAAS
ncbi:DoxX family membrane protein [Paenibacillus sp. P26]|nr:DoxX family membrane protein [Paenibacillus sp. P26]